MGPNTRQILDQALELAPDVRAELIEGLLASFDHELRKEVDTAWAAEAESRIAAFERGELPSIPADRVLKRHRPSDAE